jgi:enterochelin esterase family protein
MRLRLAGAVLVVMAIAALLPAADDYKLGPESIVQPGVLQGKIAKHSWKRQIFPGTVRDYSVYVSAQYDPQKPACVMVFQDGNSFARTA